MTNDSEFKIWTISGTVMTLIKNPIRYSTSLLVYDKSRANCERWLDTHCEGEWSITLSFIGFEMPTDAIMFKLSYIDKLGFKKCLKIKN